MNNKNTVLATLVATCLGFSTALYAHGDVVPQSVNTGELETIGEEWLDENPYRAAGGNR